MGFRNAAAPLEASTSELRPEDLVAYGFLPEFVGRLPVTASLQPLSENDMVRVLTEPKNALLRQFKHLFELEGVELVVEHLALVEIAQEAMRRKTGARALRSILETILQEPMFLVPSLEEIARIVIPKGVISNRAQPIYVSASQLREAI
jgi:ATP-dependent Clp protease ATP-binding subunit ClpX